MLVPRVQVEAGPKQETLNQPPPSSRVRKATNEPIRTVALLTRDESLYTSLGQQLDAYDIRLCRLNPLVACATANGRSTSLIVILDVHEGIGRAFSAAQPARKRYRSPHLMILGPDNALETEREAFALGAQEFVGRPFEVERVALRVKVLRERILRTQEFCFTGSLMIDKLARSVWVEGRRVRLTPSQYRLLDHLTDNLGKALPFAELAAVLGNTASQNLHLRVRQAMYQLASRLGSAQGLLVNERGYGYRLLALPRTRSDASTLAGSDP